jgi:hypothetical protein
VRQAVRRPPPRVRTERSQPPAPIPADMPVKVWHPRLGARRREDLEAVAREVDRVAEPIAAYLLAWLWAHK